MIKHRFLSYNYCLLVSRVQNRRIYNLPQRIYDFFIPTVKHEKPNLSNLKIGPIESSSVYNYNFIPLKSKTLMRKIAANDVLKHESDRESRQKIVFEDFCANLDLSIQNHYKGIVKDLKLTYTPINPDMELFSAVKLTRREKLDSEYWFLQRFSNLLKLCNFHELSKLDLEASLNAANFDASLAKVQTYFDVYKFDVLKVWVLNKENSLTEVSKTSPHKTGRFAFSSIRNLFSRTSNLDAFVHKRLVIAVRSKNEANLQLKMFRDISPSNMIQFLPAVQFGHNKTDQSYLRASLGLGLAGFVGHFVASQFSVAANIDQYCVWLAELSLLSFILIRYLSIAKQKTFLEDSYKKLYSSNLANNHGLVTLLSKYSQDELFKETLLAYVFLLHLSSNQRAVGGDQLKKAIEKWVCEEMSSEDNWAKKNFNFEIEEPISILHSLGIVSYAEKQSDGVMRFHVTNLAQANNLIRRPGGYPQLEEFLKTESLTNEMTSE